jgi:transcriptional regulator with XRE-family HTH domain
MGKLVTCEFLAQRLPAPLVGGGGARFAEEALPISRGNIPGGRGDSLAALIERLRAAASARIRAGCLTERGLARRSGLSQPHVHLFLRGARGVTVEAADRLLAALDLSAGELAAAGARRSRFEAPLLDGPLGAGFPFPRCVPGAPRLEFPPGDLCQVREPAVALVAADPAIRPWLAEGDLALLDLAAASRQPGMQPAWFAVAEGPGVVLRQVWKAPGRAWQSAPPARVREAGRNILEILSARLVWIGRKLDSQTPLGGSSEETRGAH